MPRSTCYLTLLFVHGFALAIIGCVAKPAIQRIQYQPVSNTNSYDNQTSTPVDVSDLNHSSESYVIQQLRTRGFNQVGGKPASSTGISQGWWLNLATNQCFQLETANRKVITLEPKSSQDCHNTR